MRRRPGAGWCFWRQDALQQAGTSGVCSAVSSDLTTFDVLVLPCGSLRSHRNKGHSRGRKSLNEDWQHVLASSTAAGSLC